MTPMEQLERFQQMLRDWLSRNRLDRDLHFYSQGEWHSRHAEFLNGALFVIVTEGGLYHLLNDSFDDPKVDELQDLCDSFGYWFEMGHAWSLGFYQEESSSPVSARSYEDKLKDPRWTTKAQLVKTRADLRCEDCGVKSPYLEAHHCWYRYGFEPWQYPLDAFRALCAACHKARAPIEHDARTFFARFSTSELALIRESLGELFHWYDRRAARSFLESLGPDQRKMQQALSVLESRKTEPGANSW
jgi:hypothetical protein